MGAGQSSLALISSAFVSLWFSAQASFSYTFADETESFGVARTRAACSELQKDLAASSELAGKQKVKFR